MKKYAATVAVALLALFGLAALAPSAQAYPFPPPGLTLNLSTHQVISGHKFTAHAKATVDCSKLSITWNGQSASASGSVLNHTFTAPIVTTKTVIRAHAVCDYTATAGASGHAISATTKQLTAYADVTVVPASNHGGHLPNTGGPSIGWLIAGILALLAGAGAMYAGRRRDGGAAA